MGFDKNREKAISERKAGAAKMEAEIRIATGNKASLTWSDMSPCGETYHLTAIVKLSEGRDAKRLFGFSDESLSDYPSGTASKAEEMVHAAIAWIRDQKA